VLHNALISFPWPNSP